MIDTIRLRRRAWRFVLPFILQAVAALAIGAPVDSQPGDLRVMSFNIRNSRAKEKAAENNWADKDHPRRERAIRVIRKNEPDLLGVQEARPDQVNDLKDALSEYTFNGVGRDDGKSGGEFCGIFYRTERFVQTGAGSFWLSATPEKPGTSFYTALTACPRIASWVRLKDKAAGGEFVLLNMHWDHISQPARESSASLVRERLASLGNDLPWIVIGDFNAHEDSSEVKKLFGKEDSSGRVLVDSYRVIHPKPSPDESSFNDWVGTKKGSRIDFILCTRQFKPVSANIVRRSYDGLWPSDHYPVVATLRLQQKSQNGRAGAAVE
jgi:endonuclease/exonuclease/phosphatase family metal-dependent hydrolase